MGERLSREEIVEWRATVPVTAPMAFQQRLASTALALMDEVERLRGENLDLLEGADSVFVCRALDASGEASELAVELAQSESRVAALMDEVEALANAAELAREAIRDQVKAGHPVSPRVAFAFGELRRALAAVGDTEERNERMSEARDVKCTCGRPLPCVRVDCQLLRYGAIDEWGQDR